MTSPPTGATCSSLLGANASTSTPWSPSSRTARASAQEDKEFCARGKRAFDWANSAQVSTLVQVPAPYDIGPEMNVYPCPAA
jgi:hypothetical protein